MKKNLFILLVFVSHIGAWATTRTVSNNPATLGQFNTIQAAIDASTAGDTVFVHGSPNVYGQFNLTDKNLVIIGPGWSPDKNMPFTARVAGCSLRNSTAPGSPDGTELQGLVFTGGTNTLVQNFGGDLSFGNLRFIRCVFDGLTQFQLAAMNVLFEGCIIKHSLTFNIGSTYENFLFQNNLFYAPTSALARIQDINNVINVRFDHNLFYAQAGVQPVFSGSCNALTMTNNIFVARNAGSSLSLSLFSNNITYNGGSTEANEPWAVNNNVDGGGNISNQNPQMADQTAVDAGTLNGLLDFTVSAGPANNAGSDGKDMGLLYDATGSLNWNNSRNSRLPRIYSMNITTPNVAQGGSLTVSVEARKSN